MLLLMTLLLLMLLVGCSGGVGGSRGGEPFFFGEGVFGWLARWRAWNSAVLADEVKARVREYATWQSFYAPNR